MIMRLEFDREASNKKTYGVNLDAPRLAHTRELAAQSPAGRPATPRPSEPAGLAAAAKAHGFAPGPTLELEVGKSELQGRSPPPLCPFLSFAPSIPCGTRGRPVPPRRDGSGARDGLKSLRLDRSRLLEDLGLPHSQYSCILKPCTDS